MVSSIKTNNKYLSNLLGSKEEEFSLKLGTLISLVDETKMLDILEYMENNLLVLVLNKLKNN